MIERFSGEHAYLSNPYPVKICYADEWWDSTEYAFHGMKTLDPAERAQIRDAPTWRDAKRLGRSVTLRPGWDMYWRYTVMEDLLALKFTAGSELADKLLATKPHGLIEGNSWHDQVWGDCRCGRALCTAPGMNLLGWMLMRRRATVLLEARRV